MHLALEGDFADAADPGDSRIYEGGRAKVEERNLGGGCPPPLERPRAGALAGRRAAASAEAGGNPP